MPQRFHFHLPRLLALVAVAEMMVYRLLVPVLRPPADVAPPGWHAALTYLGLFLYYFASAMALGVLAHQLWQLVKQKVENEQRSGLTDVLTWLLIPVAVVFLALSIWSIVTLPSARVTFLLEGSFVFAVVLLVLRELLTKGELGIRLGLLVLAMPLVFHYYAPFSVRYIGGEEALWNGLTDEVEAMGRWMVLLAALTIPYVLGARPFFLRAARLLPLLAAGFVGVFCAVLVRQDYIKAMELAQYGLGISFGSGAPSSLIALCLLALSAVAWTLVNTLSAPSEARRNIGVGLSLIVLGGYAFEWPLQYLLGIVGLITIAKARPELAAEEDQRITPTVPAIEDESWQQYLESVLRVLRSRSGADEAGMDKGAVITIAGEAGQSRSHFVFSRDEVTVKVTIERVSGAIVGVDVRCGDGDTTGPPIWTLHSKRASRLGIVHPSPPSCTGKEWKRKGEECLTRYRILDTASLSEKLLSESMVSRIQHQVRGWMAIWPEGSLRFQVYPGRGAPLDRPIPITALAFRTGQADPDDLLELLELLVEITSFARTAED
ncbi:MAG: hypothetical protein JKY56_14425 [Kofleriaceae bacterium]|nr:hypothetical protein [Kofleriaceae bacterium]